MNNYLKIPLHIIILPLIASAVSAGNLTYTEPAGTINPKLTEISKTFEQKTHRISGRVTMALGYGTANSAMIEGEDGLIIIDAGSDPGQGAAILAEYRKLTDKPVKAIIYTHHHMDHWGGSAAFASKEDVDSGKIEIIAHETFMTEIQSEPGFLGTIVGRRTAYHAGYPLIPIGPEGFVNLGCCPPAPPRKPTLYAPTMTVGDSREITIAGVNLELFHVPSETRDEIAVWMPGDKVIFTADVLEGEAFPNLYTLRGTRFRDYTSWYEAVDRLRSYPAEYLSPGHGRPVQGKHKVHTVMTNYRDGIQFVLDQGLRYMNKGYTPDELVQTIELPPHLKDERWLQEVYGEVGISLRGLYSGYVGWFDGDLSLIDQKPVTERMSAYVELMGGRTNILAVARKALDAGDSMWAVELLNYLIKLDRNDQEARNLQADALEQWGYSQDNGAYRNWALVEARELRGTLPMKAGSWNFLPPEMTVQKDSKAILSQMRIRLKAEDCLNVITSMGFVLTDKNESLTLQIRRGIAEVRTGVSDAVPLTIALTKADFFALAFAGDPLEEMLKAGQIKVMKGAGDDVISFFSYFEGAPKMSPPIALPALNQ